MNSKHNFFRRYPNANNQEKERKWKLYQEEQEHLRILEQLQMIQAENEQFFTTGGIAAGGRSNQAQINLTYSDLDYTPVQFDSLEAWNSHFDLPNNGPAFTEIRIDGNTISLIGQPGISLRDNIFSPYNKQGDQYLVSMVDTGCVTGSIGDRCFSNSYNLIELKLPYATYIGPWSLVSCENLSILDLSSIVTADEGALSFLTGINSISLPSCVTFGDWVLAYSNMTSVYLPMLQTTGQYSFTNCSYLLDIDLPICTSIGNYTFSSAGFTHLSIPSCTSLGSSEEDNQVFYYIFNRQITLTINPYLLTNNNGGPDGDILYLTDQNQNNTVTIN